MVLFPDEGSRPLGLGLLRVTFTTADRHTFAGLTPNPLIVALDFHGGGLMLLQYRLGFELRRSDLVIMAASIALVALTVFSF